MNPYNHETADYHRISIMVHTDGSSTCVHRVQCCRFEAETELWLQSNQPQDQRPSPTLAAVLNLD